MAAPEDAPERPQRDGWSKAEILLKPLGGILAAATVGLVSYLGTDFLRDQQNMQESWRLYAQLMSSREEADSTLRKDMFDSIIKSFVVPANNADRDGQPSLDETLKQQVLNLELLAYNFHDALDLAPLFKHLRDEIQRLETDPGAAGVEAAALDGYQRRLEDVSGEVVAKQVAALEETGNVFRSRAFLSDLDAGDGTDGPRGPDLEGQTVDRIITVEVLHVYRESREVLVRLVVRRKLDATVMAAAAEPEPDLQPTEVEVDTHFRVGFFDFPMIDNTRLPGRMRCAVVIQNFGTDPLYVSLAAIVFPDTRASLKEKPYYDEIIENLKSGRLAPDRPADRRPD